MLHCSGRPAGSEGRVADSCNYTPLAGSMALAAASVLIRKTLPSMVWQVDRHSFSRTITPIYMYIALFPPTYLLRISPIGRQSASFLSLKMKQVMILVVLVTLHTVTDQPLLAVLGISI